MAPCGPWRSANSLQYITTIRAINNFTSSYACGYQRLQKTALVADTYVDHSFIVLYVCLLLMTLVMVCCIVGANGAAKQQDFSYNLMIHGGCRAVANCPLVCPTLSPDALHDEDEEEDQLLLPKIPISLPSNPKMESIFVTDIEKMDLTPG